jgi:hypothetical protein
MTADERQIAIAQAKLEQMRRERGVGKGEFKSMPQVLKSLVTKATRRPRGR